MEHSPAEAEDPLDLTSLDSESLFKALGAVENAIPDLLVSIKPILAHLSSTYPENTIKDSQEAIENYLNMLDKIQFILRQTVYYLRETKASTTSLIPPSLNSIKTPFATTLPSSLSGDPRNASGAEADDRPTGEKGKGVEKGKDEDRGQVELGLYGSRMEVKVLDDLIESLKELRQQQGQNAARQEGEESAEQNKDGMDIDSTSPTR